MVTCPCCSVELRSQLSPPPSWPWVLCVTAQGGFFPPLKMWFWLRGRKIWALFTLDVTSPPAANNSHSIPKLTCCTKRQDIHKQPHLFQKNIWNYCKNYRVGNSNEKRKEEILSAFVDTCAISREINHYWKGIQHHLPFTSYSHCQKLSGNAWFPICLFLPIQEKQGHIGLQTSWNSFDLLGYFAAHCPAGGNHGGTGLVIGMLFSQVPWEKKRLC